MRKLALTAIGRDRPGIVAGVTAVLLRHEVNIEDSQMGILGGYFTMTLILAAPQTTDRELLGQELDAARRVLGLEALVLREVGPLGEEPAEPTHVVTVYGVDHLGIVHAATRTLADQGANVTDLNTRLLESPGEEPIYVLMMEVALPAAVAGEVLEAALRAQLSGIDVSVRERERDEL
jgi:glycine cleavage system transcriptional repressor